MYNALILKTKGGERRWQSPNRPATNAGAHVCVLVATDLKKGMGANAQSVTAQAYAHIVADALGL